MRAYHLAFLGLFQLWQSAPTPVAEGEPRGPVWLSVAGGDARWTWVEESFDCQGRSSRYTRSSRMRAFGTRLDAEPTKGLRVTAAVARVRFESSWSPGETHTIPAAQVALEGEDLGIGAGVQRETYFGPGQSGRNFYLRIGPREGGHFRLDVNDPGGTHAAEPRLRAGPAFGRGQVRKVGGFLGVGRSPYSAAVGFANLEIPVGPVDVMVRGVYGLGKAPADWGLGAGVRYHAPFGR